MRNKDLKPLIDEILSYYYNRNTRMQYGRKEQNDMLNQNRGLTNACSSVINFAEDPAELFEYTRTKIEQINQEEAQEIIYK